MISFRYTTNFTFFPAPLRANHSHLDFCRCLAVNEMDVIATTRLTAAVVDVEVAAVVAGATETTRPTEAVVVVTSKFALVDLNPRLVELIRFIVASETAGEETVVEAVDSVKILDAEGEDHHVTVRNAVIAAGM